MNELKHETLRSALFELGVETNQGRTKSLTEDICRITGHDVLRKSCSKFIQRYLSDIEESELKTGARGEPLDTFAIVRGLLTSEEYDVRKAVAIWLGNGGKKMCENEAIVQLLQKRLLGREDNIDCLTAVRFFLSFLHS